MTALLLALVAGCTGGGAAEDPTAPPAGGDPTPTTDGAPATTPPATATDEATDPTPTPSDPPTTEPTATTADLPDDPAELCRLIGPEWCEDADGNSIPDFVELAIDRDPAVEDCVAEACPGAELDQLAAGELEANTMLILDASGSMAGPDGSGRTKMDAAKEAVVRYAVGTPDFVDLGLMVYGHVGSNAEADRDASCAGIETFAGIGELDHTTVDAAVAGFDATGWTPISASLQRAADELRSAAAAEGEGVEVASRVILVTDGIETCGGDPVAVATELAGSDIAVVIDVVGFDIAEGDQQALRAIAEATGGTYHDARDGAALRDVFLGLLGQRNDALHALVCAVSNQAQVSACTASTQARAGVEISRHARQALQDGDPDRAELITAFQHAVAARYGALTDELADQLSGRSEEYQRMLDEAAARLEERFGEEVSSTFACTADLQVT